MSFNNRPNQQDPLLAPNQPNGNDSSFVYVPNDTMDSRVSKKSSEKRKKKSSGRRRKKSSGQKKIGATQLLLSYMRDPNRRPAVYVLFVMLTTYMFNQVDRYLISILSSDMQTAQGWGNGDGGGSKYDLLAGPIFTVIYLPAGIPVAGIADRHREKRSLILAVALIVWSLSCVWTGFSTSYYEVAIARFILALAESACTPLAGSIISDYFPKETRATALGIYNWGIYTGFSMAVGAANAMTDATGWRTVWLTFGFAGICWAPFVLTIKTKDDRLTRNSSFDSANKRLSINASAQSKRSSRGSHGNDISRKNSLGDKNIGICFIIKYFLTTPSIILLFVASLIRNAGGYVWAYNTKNFFTDVKNQTNIEEATYLLWIPLIGGSLGAFFGGFISDRYVQNAPSWKRIVILVFSNLAAAPFAFFALYLDPPISYLMLIGSNVIGEMWVGITLCLVIELSPGKMKTTAISIYFFFIGFAGFFPELVTPVKNLFDSYTFALILLFPGLYVLGALLFFLTLVTIRRDKRRAKELSLAQLG